MARPQATRPNVVPLDRLLKGASASFKEAVTEALLKEGFELEETLPNLQLPREILDAIDWLESRGHGHHWKRFEAVLLAADREGLLVDLGLHAIPAGQPG